LQKTFAQPYIPISFFNFALIATCLILTHKQIIAKIETNQAIMRKVNEPVLAIMVLFLKNIPVPTQEPKTKKTTVQNPIFFCSIFL
jgi:hypothetical protein